VSSHLRVSPGGGQGAGSWYRAVLEPHRRIATGAYVGLAAASFGFVVLLWSVLTYGRFVQPFFLPSPGNVATTVWELFTTQGVWPHVVASTYRVVVGWFLSAILAIPLGVLMASYHSVEALAEPLNDVIRYMPVVAFVPLTILWLGVGDEQKIAVIFLGTFFQLVLMVADAVSKVPRSLLETAQTLGVGSHESVWKIALPGAWPMIFDHLRVTMGWAWSYLVVAELVASSRGIGFMIIQAQRLLQTRVVIAGILIVGFLGLAFDLMFKLLTPVVCPWNRRH